MSMHVLAASLAVLLASMPAPAPAGHAQSPGPAPVAATGDDSAMQPGRELSQLFLAGDTDAVWARMTPQMQSALGSAATLAGFRETLARDLGEEEGGVDESAPAAAGTIGRAAWCERRSQVS